MMNYPRIQSVKAVDEHTLLVEFDDRSRRLYDVSPLFEREAFVPLKDFALFKAVKVDTGGYAVYWNEDIDLSEYELWKNGKVVEN